MTTDIDGMTTQPQQLGPQGVPRHLGEMAAIVTGGGKGIGLAVAAGLARQGCSVSIWDADERAMKQAVAALGSLGATVDGSCVDVTSPAQIAEAVAKAHGRFGSIDLLVNNAGIGGEKLLADVDLEFWMRVLNVNLTSQLLCCKAVTPFMVERRFGRIVNISSRAWLGNRGQVCYSASKGGVVSLTRTLALEYARKGITVNAIAPGIIDTPLFGSLPAKLRESLEKTVPQQKTGSPDDIANAVTFFAAPAASYVTGQLLYVCGGRSLSSTSV